MLVIPEQRDSGCKVEWLVGMLVKIFCRLNSRHSNFLWLVEGVFLRQSCFLEDPLWCHSLAMLLFGWCFRQSPFIVLSDEQVSSGLSPAHADKSHSVLEWVVNGYKRLTWQNRPGGMLFLLDRRCCPMKSKRETRRVRGLRCSNSVRGGLPGAEAADWALDPIFQGMSRDMVGGGSVR